MPPRKLSGQKAYSHLIEGGRQPSAYEVASTKLHCYPALGFGVTHPVGAWYRQHQPNAAFRPRDLEAFADPRQTTYASYMHMQAQAEAYLAGVLDRACPVDDLTFDDEWIGVLARVFAPLRYPCHALMMLAAHLGSMTPESRMTIAAGFQMADEMRRVDALARRLHQLRGAHPRIAVDSRNVWQHDALWQRLRRFVERALVIYEWSESFVVVNLVLKPAFDRLFIHTLSQAASVNGDPSTAQVLRASDTDARWHQAWSSALIRSALERSPAARDRVVGWISGYGAKLDDALKPLESLIEAAINGAIADGSVVDVAGEPSRGRSAWLASCGLAEVAR